MNPLIISDLKELKQNFIFSNNLKGKTILVTGGTGLIGSLLIDFFSLLNSSEHLNIHIIGMARNSTKTIGIGQDVEWIIQDMCDPIVYDGNIDYVFHTASPTQSAFLFNNPVETINQIYNGGNNILRFSKDHNVSQFLFLSSMEIYGQHFNDNPLEENSFGYIDLSNPRNSYSESKRLMESLCSSYYHEYNLVCKIARLTQTFGRGISKDDKRVFSQFVKCVVNNEDIVLHTKGKSAKNYVYTTDAINAFFYILFKGNPGETYNVANDDSYISIEDMAYFVKNTFNKSINVIFDLKNDMGYAPETLAKLSSDKLRSLGWKPQVSLKEMFDRTISYYRSL
jgi:UDP-glucuronate decarboxylase